MSMVTVIRHQQSGADVLIVVTDFATGFTARFQHYVVGRKGRTVLCTQSSFSTEQAAVDVWKAAVREIDNV